MDIKSLIGNVLNNENLTALTQKTGLGADKVQNVIGKALPFMADSSNSGKSEEEAVRAISAEAGATDGETKSILTEAAPMLVNLLGGGSAGGSTPSQGGMMGMLMGLLGNADMGSMLGGMLGGSGEAPQQQEQSGGLMGGLLGGLLKKE